MGGDGVAPRGCPYRCRFFNHNKKRDMNFCYDTTKVLKKEYRRKRMSYSQTVWHWMKEVSRRFPNLSWPQAKALACYSMGMVLADTCGLTQVADSVAEVLGQKRQRCFQRLRE